MIATTPGDWWEDRHTDWTRGEPSLVVDVLAKAYPGLPAIRRLSDSAGIEWPQPPAAASAGETWSHVLGRAAALGLVFDLIAEVRQDADSEAFRPLIERLLGDRLGLVTARQTFRHGLPPPPPDGPDPLVKSLEEVPNAPGDEPTSGLEAITAVTAGLEDPRAMVQAIVDATRRTAMIEIGGLPKGTGFLVGPDLLLTAAHVIDRKAWPPDPRPEVVARFDYGLQAGRSPAENGVPVPVVDFVAASLPTDAEVEGRTADWEAPADRLDFALLRLGSDVPSPEGADEAQPRGSYPLDTTDYDFTRSPLLFIVQHPLGQFQRVTWIRSAPTQNAGRTRIRYGGNTLAGSSGSPVIDVRGRLVALHHYSERGSNQGVPLSVIARAIGPTVTEDRRPLNGDPFLANSLRGRPFVNRTNLRGRIREMACDGNGSRLLTIKGESGSGVTYSYQLISHIAHRSSLSRQVRAAVPGGLAALPINVADYVEFGVEERRERIARDILVGLCLPYTEDALAQAARNITTFRQALRAGLRDSARQWWIFVDGLDQLVAIQQGDLDELIHALVLVAEDEQVPLRVVLAGREAEQFAAERSLWVQHDLAVGLARSEVEAWFRDRAREERQVLDEQALADAMTELFPLNLPLPEPRRLASQLPQRLLDLLEASRGS
jgi:Trypsin-like peptidase domain